MKNSTGRTMHIPQDIRLLQTFYNDLYTSYREPDSIVISSFLNNIDLPKLAKELADSLEAPLMNSTRHLTKMLKK